MDSIQKLNSPHKIGRKLYISAAATGAKSLAYTGSVTCKDGKQTAGSIQFPVYVPLDDETSGGERHKRAMQIVGKIGESILETSKFDFLEFIKNGTLPFGEYLEHVVEKAKKEGDFSRYPEYRMTFTFKGGRIELKLIDNQQGVHPVTMPIPNPEGAGGEYKKRFERIITEIVHEKLGKDFHRDATTSGANRLASMKKERTYRTKPLKEYFKIRSVTGSKNYFISIEGGGVKSEWGKTLSIATGTDDKGEAESQKDSLYAFICSNIDEHGSVTSKQIRGHAEKIIAGRNPSNDAEKVTGNVNEVMDLRKPEGAIMIYAPAVNGSSREALSYKEAGKLSSRLLSNGRGDYSIRLLITNAGGNANSVIDTTVTVKEDLGLSVVKAEELRWKLRQYVAEQLGQNAMYDRVGALLRPEELEADGSVTIEGRRRILETVLEGRINSKFIENALLAKEDPFSLGLDYDKIRRFGGEPAIVPLNGWSVGLSPEQMQIPEPLNARISLEDVHESRAFDGYISLTVRMRSLNEEERSADYAKEVFVRTRTEALKLINRINDELPPGTKNTWETAKMLHEICSYTVNPALNNRQWNVRK